MLIAFSKFIFYVNEKKLKTTESSRKELLQKDLGRCEEELTKTTVVNYNSQVENFTRKYHIII